MTAIYIILIGMVGYLFMIAPNLKRKDISALTGILYAHRGFHMNSDGICENSLAAFEAAMRGGYGIELDVQLTRDGIPVVFHDKTLNRLCGVDKRLGDLTLAQLKTLRLLNSREGIPTFEEALTFIGGQVPLMVEIKGYSHAKALTVKTMGLLRQYSGAYGIQSFHPLVGKWLKRHAPQVIRGQLIFAGKHQPPRFLNWGLRYLLINFLSRPDFISTEIGFKKTASLRLILKFFHLPLAGWTFRSLTQLENQRTMYEIQIFEGFTPNG